MLTNEYKLKSYNLTVLRRIWWLWPRIPPLWEDEKVVELKVKPREEKMIFHLGGSAKEKTTRFGFSSQNFFVKHTNQREFVTF